MNICVWGDSIMWGERDAAGGWASRLRARCAEEHEDIVVYPLGVRGETAAEVRARLACEAAARQPTVAICAVGTNDALWLQADNEERPRTTIEDFYKQLRELHEQALTYCSIVLFVGMTRVDEDRTTPVAWNDACYYTSARLQRYSQVVAETATACGAHFVQVSDLLSDTSLLADGLHPTATGHQLISERVYTHLVNELDVL